MTELRGVDGERTVLPLGGDPVLWWPELCAIATRVAAWDNQKAEKITREAQQRVRAMAEAVKVPVQTRLPRPGL